MTPYYNQDGITIFHGDCREVLPELEAGSVHCCVTSPPYWGLRDYGTGTWEGGEEGCDHKKDAVSSRGADFRKRGEDKGYDPGSNFANYGDRNATASDFEHVCGKCGARRIDSQIGLESSLDEYVATMVEVFREVRRVLRDDGTCWINLGDGFADKQLQGAPWRVAFALQADGWYLRQDIIWHKPNPMPESVTDRCTKAHEYLFLLSKSPRYFFDADAIKEPSGRAGTLAHYASGNGSRANAMGREPSGNEHPDKKWTATVPDNRNRRSVWTIPTQPYAAAHFATFPQKLIQPCIKAGTSEEGCCPECGAPWERVVEHSEEYRERLAKRPDKPSSLGDVIKAARIRAGIKQGELAKLFPSVTGGLTGCVSNWELGKNIPTTEQWDVLVETLGLGPESTELAESWWYYERGVWGESPETLVAPSAAPALSKGSKTTGWRPTCECPEHKPIPCTVLDPFLGSGTTAYVARQHQCNAIGIELNEDYLQLVTKRLEQRLLFT